MRRRLPLLSLVSLCVPAGAWAQTPDVLTLDEALRMARQRNGNIRAAELDVLAARSRVRQAAASFLPTVTPSFLYRSTRRDGAGIGSFGSDRGSLQANAAWEILDSGQRDLTLRSTRRSQEAQSFNTLQTLRNTLFVVHQQYIETRRAQELQRVAESQVGRAQEIVRQTEARIEARDAARKDLLQATADLMNAQVLALGARNRTATNAALLKATIGLDTAEPLPSLEASPEVELGDRPPSLEGVVREGLTNRADLRARRLNLQALQLNQRRAQTEAGLTYGLSANVDQQFTPDSQNNRVLTFSVSYPLFDGGRLREQARELGFSVQAEQAVLLQAERDVRSEIESAFAEYLQNEERVRAARAALLAAQENFRAASESQRLGAATLIDVLTAQVSLVTAESNSIEANFDYTLSEVRLRLVLGRPLPGEDTASS